MATKRKRIVRYTDKQLKTMRAAGKVGSDWRRAAKTAVPSGRNPDDAIGPVDIKWALTELPLPRRKAHTTLRLDADLLDWFRSQGSGYQTRINAVLRSYYEQRSRSTR
jgi:uncharacterized protein (DUF4415 family)